MSASFLQHLVIPNIYLCYFTPISHSVYCTILTLVFCSRPHGRKGDYASWAFLRLLSTTNLPSCQIQFKTKPTAKGWQCFLGSTAGDWWKQVHLLEALVIPTGCKDNQRQRACLRHCHVCRKVGPVIPALGPRKSNESC